MSQGTTVLPTTGTVSGLAMTQNMNAALDALLTNNSGASAPASPSAYQLWLDTSSTPKTLKMRNATNDAWVVIGYIQDGVLTWTSLTSFGSGWTGVGVGYTKDLFGMVHLRGLLSIAAGADDTAFTLPSGFRPAQQLTILARLDSSFGGDAIITTGGALIKGAAVTVNGNVPLDIIAPFVAA